MKTFCSGGAWFGDEPLRTESNAGRVGSDSDDCHIILRNA